ncbi:MAG TPA: ABC transporter substrate-binding protein [Verrucomicrobiae bacterium]|nr:ABC transporter substrate-binding protein [Verrucomicrobiae bacterium]
MSKRTLLIAAILSAAVAAFVVLRRPTAPQGDSKTLVVGVENDLINLDPAKIVDNFTLRVAAQVVEGLVTLDEKDELAPALIESWIGNADSTEWKLQVRSGVKFHLSDCFGTARTREMTAEDIAYSLRRILSQGSPSAFALVGVVEGAPDFNAGKTDALSGVRVEGDSVVVRLTKPDPAFLYRLTSPWFAVVPREAVNLGPDVFGRTVLVGTGPFQLVSRKDNEVKLFRNPDYWGKADGNVSELAFRVIKNDAIRLAELRGGKIGLMRLPDTLVSEVAVQKPGPSETSIRLQPAFGAFTATVHPVFNSHFLGFNYTQVPRPLRVAVSKAIRRAEIATTVTGGLGTPAAGPLPIGLRGYQPSPLTDWESVDGAKKDLSDNPDVPKTIEILVHEKDASEQVAELIQSQLAAVGITATITRLDFNGVIDRVLKNNAQAFMLSFEYVFSTPELILSGFFSPEAIPVPNLFGFKDDRFNALLGDLAKPTPENKPNFDLVRTAENLLVGESPAAFLFQKRSAVLARAGTAGVWISGNNILPFQDVTIP